LKNGAFHKSKENKWLFHIPRCGSSQNGPLGISAYLYDKMAHGYIGRRTLIVDFSQKGENWRQTSGEKKNPA
jgi:hypothetical protein